MPAVSARQPPDAPSALDVLTGREPLPEGPPLREWSPVTARRKVAENTWWLELASPGIAAASVPGQFLMVGYGLENTGAPFLPRPFSVGWRSEGGRVGLLLRSFGEGTRRMARLRAGDELLLLGPLGRPFRLDADRRAVSLDADAEGGEGRREEVLGGLDARAVGGLRLRVTLDAREPSDGLDPPGPLQRVRAEPQPVEPLAERLLDAAFGFVQRLERGDRPGSLRREPLVDVRAVGHQQPLTHRRDALRRLSRPQPGLRRRRLRVGCRGPRPRPRPGDPILTTI